MAEENDASQKTEQPTPRQLEKAREKGRIPLSREVTHGFVLGALILSLTSVLPHTLPVFVQFLAGFIAQSHHINAQNLFLGRAIGKQVGFSFALPFLLIIGASLSASILQTRFKISTESLKPKFTKLSPIHGFSRLFSSQSFVEFGKNVVKVILVTLICGILLWSEIKRVAFYQHLSLKGILDMLDHLVLKIFQSVLVFMALLALLDYGWQRFHLMRSLRMSRQEIKEEVKEQEGDPYLKARLKSLRQERARRRMIQRIPDATLLIMNPTHYAVALKYDPETMGAPQVIAKGIDFLALRLRERAEEYKIPVVENPPLARSLYDHVELDQEIPLEYYEIVAKVIQKLMLAGKLKLKV